MSSETKTEPGESDAASRGVPTQVRIITAAVAGAALLLGWIFILYVNHWHWGAPVFFMCAGWLALLATMVNLARAGWSAALDDPKQGDDESFWRPLVEMDELRDEKRALLNAIKEIEFDHEMGKMSDDDAAELTRYYRLRAIEVIKQLDQGSPGDTELTVAERIQRDLNARLELGSLGKKAAKKRKPGGPSANEAGAEKETEA